MSSLSCLAETIGDEMYVFRNDGQINGFLPSEIIFMNIALILCSGEGKRMGESLPKQFLLVKDKPLFFYSTKTFNDLDEIDFCWDFLKLNFYVDEFKFKNALYMLVNIDRKQIIKMFNIYREKIGYYCNDMSKIWLFVQKWDGEKMSSVNIYQIEREPAKNKR